MTTLETFKKAGSARRLVLATLKAIGGAALVALVLVALFALSLWWTGVDHLLPHMDPPLP